MEAGITAAYKSHVNLTAQNLQAGFTEDLTDLRTGVTEAYQAAIDISARGLRTDFSASITDLNGKLTTHTSGFHVTATKIEGIVADITEQGTSYSRLTQTVSGITAEVNDFSGRYSSLKVQVDAIGTLVGDGTEGSFSEFQQTIDRLTTQVANNKTAAAGALTAAQNAASAASNVQSKANSAYDKAVANATAITQTNSVISAIAGRFDANGHLIEGAGWVTTADAVTLYATKQTVSSLGDRVTSAESRITANADSISLTVKKGSIISAINQTAESVTIDVSKINLNGKVTISMLGSDVKNTIDSKVSTNSLGSLAYKDAVELTQLGDTIIEGGYIKTGLINADLIVAKKLKTNTSNYSVSLDNDGLAITTPFLVASEALRMGINYVSNTYDTFLEMHDSVRTVDFMVKITPQGIRFYENGVLTKSYSSK